VVGTAVGTGRGPRPCPWFVAQNLVMNVTKDLESNDCVCLMFFVDVCKVISMASVVPESLSQAFQIRRPGSTQPQHGICT